MSKPREYTVRTFDPVNEPTGNFNCTGTMDKLPTYQETVIAKQYIAVAMIATSNSSANAVRENAGSRYNLDDQEKLGDVGLDVIDIKVGTYFTVKADLNAHRKAIFSIIKTWAEKSRVKGVRGWRANAIKSPKFKMNHETGMYDLDFEVIFSNAIHYDESNVTITNKTFIDDLKQFKKRLLKEIPIKDIKYDHSSLGCGGIDIGCLEIIKGLSYVS